MMQKQFNKKKFLSQEANEAQIFNRDLIRLRKDAIAEEFHNHDFLNQEITSRLLDNLQDIKRNHEIILNLSCDDTQLQKHFDNKLLINQELSSKMLERKSSQRIQADEEFMPYKPGSFDLILSCLSLHWVNDLPGTLVQILHSLKSDGLFMGALFGGETLTELRQSMLKAEINLNGGISPHISPFIDVRDAGALMQRAGFALPVVNMEKITVTYSDAFALMKELKAMGENNALIKSYKGLTSPKLMIETAKIYHENFANEKGRIPVTFDILYLQGWSPHESQQKPLKPGSAKMSLKDALGKFPPKETET